MRTKSTSERFLREAKGMRRIVPNEEACMGCTLCQVNCILAHSAEGSLVKAYRSIRPQPRIKLSQNRPLSVAVQCHHCSDPPCVNACLTGAMYKDQATGYVKHDRDRCTGCLTCVMVCPFGAIVFEPSRSSIPWKCDLCPDLDVPACVANCPNEALVLEESTH